MIISRGVSEEIDFNGCLLQDLRESVSAADAGGLLTLGARFNAAIARIEALEAENARLKEALKPFAAMPPSSFFAKDGSEAEGYTFALHDQHIAILYWRKPDLPDFTGMDLARARAALGEKP